ncbi:MAG: hypothetical protein R3Y06_09840 [Faecalibacterium sp.]
MEENSQWQAFVETGEIHHYLRYKEQQAQAMAQIQPQKELADGRICDVSTGTTRSEV